VDLLVEARMRCSTGKLWLVRMIRERKVGNAMGL
jgi:hypothetical protein